MHLFRKLPALVAGGIVIGASLVSAGETLLLLGDSMMKAIAPTLEDQFTAAGFTVHATTAIGTGLARLDLYDWMAQGSQSVARVKPQAAVIMMGANDNQPLRTATGVARFGSPEWRTEYSNRVERLLALLQDGGVRRVVWVELPAMREARLDTDVQLINSLGRQAVERRKLTYFETRRPLGKAPDGAYSAYLLQANGMPLHVRSEDGIHLNRKGAEWLAGQLVPALKPAP